MLQQLIALRYSFRAANNAVRKRTRKTTAARSPQLSRLALNPKSPTTGGANTAAPDTVSHAARDGIPTST